MGEGLHKFDDCTKGGALCHQAAFIIQWKSLYLRITRLGVPFVDVVRQQQGRFYLPTLFISQPAS